MDMPRVLIPITHGVDELAVVTLVTTLRTAGCRAITATVGVTNPVVGSHRVRLMADLDLADALTEWGSAWDLVVLVGGAKASAAFLESAPLMKMLQERQTAGGLMAAVGQDVWSLVGLPEPGGDTRQELVVDDSRLGVAGFASAARLAAECVRLLRGEAAVRALQEDETDTL